MRAFKRRALAPLALWSLLCGLRALAEPPAADHVFSIAERIPGPDAGQWDYASIDPVHRRLYVTRTRGVTAFDLDGDSVRTLLADSHEGRAAVVLPGGREAVSTFETGSAAVIYDPLAGEVRASLTVPPGPDAAVYDPHTQWIYVISGSGDISLIDPAKRAIVGSIHVGGSLEYAAVDGRGRLFVNDGEANRIVAVDIARRHVVARHPLGGCEGPTGLAYVAAEDLLVSVCANGVAKAIVARTGRDLATLAVGPGADAVIHDAAHGQLYIPSGDDGTLSVIQLQGRGRPPIVVDRIATQRYARTGALDPVTGALYLPVAERIPGADWEVPPVAGTFQVLVLRRR